MAKRKHLTAKSLYEYLRSLKIEGQDLDKIKVNYRKNYDSDVKKVSVVEEDLYDSKTNSVLKSIVLITKTKP